MRTDFVRHETGLHTGTIQAPGNQADGDQVSLVLFANRLHECFNPGGCDFVAGPFIGAQGNPLHKMFSPKAWAQPVGSLFLTGMHDRFIHQVIAENGRTLRTLFRDSFPEHSLGLPAFLVSQLIVPGRHILFVITAQSGQIDIDARAFGELQQLTQFLQRLLARLIRSGHEFAKLNMDAYYIRTQLFHLGEVLFHLLPVRLPVIFQQLTLTVMVVIESPGNIRLLIFRSHERFSIRADLDPG